MQFKIDDNIPIPPKTSGNGAKRKYPFDDLAVGQSCFVPAKKSAAITAVFRTYKPKKFTVRTVTESGVTGARVWRTE